MKKWIAVVCLILVFWLACARKDSGIKLEKGTPAYELARAVADSLPYLDPDINNVLLTTKYFDLTVGDVIQNIYANYGDRAEVMKMYRIPILYDAIQKAMMGLSEKKLLLRSANKAGIGTSKAEVDSVLESEYRKAGSEENFRNNLNNQGIDFDYAKEDLKDRLIIFKYVEKYLEKETQVNEAEIQEAYKEVTGTELATVRHILLRTNNKTESEKKELRKKLERILQRARKGEDFADLAKQYTEDPGSKENGGLYENFSKGEMVKPFEEAAFSVPIGTISDIIETKYGYHIVKVIDRKTESRTLQEMRTELEMNIKREKQNTVYPSYISRLKEEAELAIRHYE
jgi:foldase protein PrsA